MNWKLPPVNYEELMLWRCFVETQKDFVWGIIHKWVKKFGNPFKEIIMDDEDYDIIQKRRYFQEAIRYTFPMRK